MAKSKLKEQAKNAESVEKIDESKNTGSEVKADSGKNNKRRNKSNRPGRLSGSIPFEIHTMDAQMLFTGYSNKDSLGLLRFGGQMTDVWEAAENDDPYADWYLLKVYDAVIQLRNQLAQAIQDYQEKVRENYGRANLPLMPFASQKPIVKNLWFRTQYGYLGANVVADFDELMRVVLTAHRVGVLLEKPQEAIRSEWFDKVISLFQIPFNWKAYQITRSDVKANTELAKEAEASMGKLPKQILNKGLRSPFSPYINAPIEKQQEAVDEQKATKTEK